MHFLMSPFHFLYTKFPDDDKQAISLSVYKFDVNRLTVVINDSGGGSVVRTNHHCTVSGGQGGCKHLVAFKYIIICHGNVDILHSFTRCKGHHYVTLPTEVSRI